MHQVRYGLFFDNHTQMENPDVGRDFDPEYFTDRIKECGVDYLAFHARCNVGMAYYDTRIGIKHPALKRDLFGELAACCKKKNIALVAYFNGGISTMEGVQHREWRTQYLENDSFGKISPKSITMCFNSPYRDHLIAMIREVAQNYPGDGFFIDCLSRFPCVCPTCVKMMQEQGIDFTDIYAVTEFARQSVLRLCHDISDAVREQIPDPMLYFNGPVFGSVSDIETFFDCECLPTAGWGYEFLPTLAHFVRNIVPGRQVLNMTGRFYDWGDFGGLRTAESLKFDLFYGAAHGMRPNIGGHFHPRGDKDDAVFDRIREVYQDLQKYDGWTIDAAPLTDIAIVYPFDEAELRYRPGIRSAVRMLEELKMQFDLVLADSPENWDRYKLLILPEDVPVNECLAERIRRFIANGGAFFACGKTAAETFGAELGIECQGDSGMDPVYFRMNGDYSKDLDDMDLSLYAPACSARVKDASGASRLVKPYYNRSWAGTHAIFYTPPQEETELPFITKKDRCIWCAGDLFTGYANRGAIHFRNIVRNILDDLLETPLVKVEKLPSFARLVLTEQPGRLNVHVISYVPEKRNNAFVVEDPAAILNGKFSVFVGDRDVASVMLVPEQTPVAFSRSGGYVHITLPPMEGYALVSITF